MTSPEYQRRERQFEIDRICAAYADEVESGRNPDPKDYLTRYPQYAVELADYIITYHLSLADLPERLDALLRTGPGPVMTGR